jgi:hypothetical protein
VLVVVAPVAAARPLTAMSAAPKPIVTRENTRASPCLTGMPVAPRPVGTRSEKGS